MKSTIKHATLVVIFIAAVAGIFVLAQQKVTKDVTHCGLISIMAACVLIYIYNRYAYGAIAQYQPPKDLGPELKESQARAKRFEEKVRKLTAELSAARVKLETEISSKPLDQRELQQRLKHLNCLYGLSKIVNRQEIPLEQIFHETVYLIRDAFRYPNAMSVRIIFDGIRYEMDNFKKSETSRQTRIKAQSEDVGAIEVYHIGGDSQSGQDVFLKEEDDLLSAVAEWLGSIAERKKAEEKLRLFRNLIERSNDCIFAVEPKWGRFLDVNNRACDSLGYTQKELLNMMTLKDIEEARPDDDAWRKQVEQLQQRNDIVKESRYKRKDGTAFFVETSLKLVSQEKQDYIIAIARDITERKRAEATLKVAQEKLLETAREVGMAEVATGVLHNVGNVLNSVSVTAESIQKRVRNSKIFYLGDVVSLLEQHKNELGAFITTEDRGKKLPAFLANLSEELVDEQKRCLEALEALTKHVQHVGDIIQLQQSHSKAKGLIEPTSISELVEDTLQINSESLTRNNVDVRREIANLPTILVDRHKVLQMLTNLISNAIHALAQSGRDDKILKICVEEPKDGFFRIAVCDNGIGIPQENLTRIFEHGFTTKKRGHGFGLHSTALSANELNGSIKVHSDGPGKGAVFTIELPYKTQEATI